MARKRNGNQNHWPLPEGDEKIVQVSGLRGSNLLEVEYPNKERVLCIIPARYQKKLWIKRGQFIIIEPFTDLKRKEDTKIQGRIAHVLSKDQIKHVKREGLWPPEFEDQKEEPDEVQARAHSDEEGDNTESESDEEDLDPYLVNPNRRVVEESESDSDDSSDEDEGGD